MNKYAVILLMSLVSVTLNVGATEEIIGHCRDYPPELSFENGRCVGAVPDLVSDLFKDLGHDIVWMKVPWVRSIREAELGKVDLLIRHSMTPERESFLLALPYSHNTRTVVFYKSPQFHSKIGSYEDLRKLNVGAIRGNFYSPGFLTLKNENLTLVSETEQLIGMLERGRIDVAVTSASHSEAQFAKRFEKAVFVETFFNPLYISIPKSSKAALLYDDVVQLMQQYREADKIRPYFEKYNLPFADVP